MTAPTYCPVHETPSGFCSADCPDRIGWKDLATLVANVRGMPEFVVRMAERIEELAAGHADLAARVDTLLDEQVAIEQRIVDAGIESPDSLTPAGTDVPNRILGMVEDLLAELGETKNTIKGLRIKNACLLDNADREHGYAIARLTADLNGTKHALRIYEETASTLGVQVDHLERRLATAWRELDLTRKAAARRKVALRRLEGAYLYARKEARLAKDVVTNAMTEITKKIEGVYRSEMESARGLATRAHRRTQEAESRAVTAERANEVLQARLDGAVEALGTAREAARHIVFAMHIYEGHTLDSRGPRGCMWDALEKLAPHVHETVSRRGWSEAYEEHFERGDEVPS